MAKIPQPDAETPKKKGKGASMLVWGLMSLLILGLGGFGVTNFGGGVRSIGAVGDRDISTNDYARALSQELNAFGAQIGQPVNLQQGIAFGLDKQVLQGLITRATLDDEAARIGISVGDAAVAKELAGMKAFQGVTGTFDPETYRFALKQGNLNESDFEAGLRSDVARSLLQGAVAGGFAAPAVLTDTLYAYAAERRAFSLLKLDAADLATQPAAPTDAELTAFYDANIATFTKPEARRVTYISLLPEMIAADMAVDDVAIKALYDERIAEFVQPERRLVERLVFPTDADATAAKAKIDAGETFESLVAARGLSLEDVDMGDVGPADLGAAADAVFALTEPGIVGPFASDLGPALFRMNGVLPAQETTFDDAKADLAAEAQLDAARRAIGDKLEAVDDALAGGATLEEVQVEQGMELVTFDYVPGAESDDKMVGYEAFRAAADAITEGDFPEAIALDDGGLVALRLDAIVPPAPIPFAEAKEKVAEAFTADVLAKALSAQALVVKSAVKDGASLGAFGIVRVAPELPRTGFFEDAPEGLLAKAFDMEVGDIEVIEAPGFVGVLRLDTVVPAAAEGEDATAMKAALAAQIEQAISQDAFAAFTSALTAKSGITLDQNAINAVHAQFN
jgi:peptidyl-prolyl cis-trans isomerase D